MPPKQNIAKQIEKRRVTGNPKGVKAYHKYTHILARVYYDDELNAAKDARSLSLIKGWVKELGNPKTTDDRKGIIRQFMRQERQNISERKKKKEEQAYVVKERESILWDDMFRGSRQPPGSGSGTGITT
jgi:hypothetical protein